MKHRFVPDFSTDMFAVMEGVCDTPSHFYHLFVGDSFMAVVVVVDYSPTTVGAYRIRPDVGEYEMMAVNNASLV